MICNLEYLFIYPKLYRHRNIEQCYHKSHIFHISIITYNCFPSNLFRVLVDMSKRIRKSLYSLYYLCFTQHPNLFGIGVVLTDSVLCHFHVRQRSTKPIEHFRMH